MFSNQLWAAKVDSSSLIGEGGESIWDSLVENLSWKHGTVHMIHGRSPGVGWFDGAHVI